MKAIDNIIDFTEVEFKNKLDMLVPELAEKVQYVGYERKSDSRIELIFKTSVWLFEFRVIPLVPFLDADIDKLWLHYKDLYYAFRDIKYKHLNKQS